MYLLQEVVCGDGRRDEQIAALAALAADPAVLGSDLNAPPAVVRPLLDGSFADSLGWDERPTWRGDAEEFVRAWEQKLGEKPRGEPEARRLDYLLYRGLEIAASGTVCIRDLEGSASDHCLVWADISGAG